MSKKFHIASVISVTATFLVTLASSSGSGARAQDIQIPVVEAQGASAVTTNPLQDAVPAVESAIPQPETHNAVEIDAVPSVFATSSAASLSELVDGLPVPASLSSELNCLAGAIYFESKGESLAGQLAVGRVIVARANSGRFPGSYCGVVYQPSQFSFVHGHAMPAINKDRRDWATAARIAMIADKGAWKSPVEGAMFFHAARVAPSWGKTRMARVDNHVFYR